MSAITPVTSTPANGSSPSGLLTSSNPLVRLQAYIASGAADLFLIQRFESGDWCKVPHAVIRLDSNRPDGNSGQIDGAVVAEQHGIDNHHAHRGKLGNKDRPGVGNDGAGLSGEHGAPVSHGVPQT